MPKFTATLIICLGTSLLSAVPGLAHDADGAKDHPLVGRYEGATAVFYKTTDFDEAVLLKAPHDYNALLERDAVKDRSGDEWLRLEGKVTQIRYEGPEGRSSLEVMKNFETSLAAKGFEVVFACKDADCLTGKLTDNYLIGQQLDPTNGNSGAYSDHARYLLAEHDEKGATLYAAILVSEAGDLITTFVQVVETKGIEEDKIVVPSADQMEATIKETGKIDLYGILFDFDQVTLKPESKDTLDQVAQLMQRDPGLKLQIIGHTDNKGAADYNLTLSEKRAARVVDALVKTYGINSNRLTSSGAGADSPVASNDDDEGRAKNRRVELLAK